MAKTFAIEFYSSRAWKKCREAYKKQQGYLCERCAAKGLYTPGVIVHHRTRVSPETIDDPEVLLNFDNLELLCRECHEAEHKNDRIKKKENDRYVIGEDGKIVIKTENDDQ